MAALLEFENHRVRVWRVVLTPGESITPQRRGDRVVVFLTDNHVLRDEDGTAETIQRVGGDFAWRDASQHRIEHRGSDHHETLIIELKD